MDEVSRTTGIMKRDAVGRVSYTEQQREALLEEFERSGLKGAQLALAAGIKIQHPWPEERFFAARTQGKSPVR